ncbi:glutathione-disulfide reductase, partial [Reticulomyxa filosa]
KKKKQRNGIIRNLFDRLVQCGVHEALLHSGADVITGADIAAIEKKEDLLLLKCQDKREFKGYDCVIYAVGRGPLSTELGLEHTSVKQDKRGFIITNEWEETHQKGIYALGDVNNKVPLTPVAIRAGRKWADRVFGSIKDAKMEYDLVPSVIFSHPPIGTIGLTEEHVREQVKNKKLPEPIKIYETHFRDLKYGMYSNQSEKVMTHMKLVCVGKEEKIVGLHMIGDGCDESLQGFAVAIKMGATKEDFDNITAIHPTAAEELVTIKVARGDEDNYSYNCGPDQKVDLK